MNTHNHASKVIESLNQIIDQRFKQIGTTFERFLEDPSLYDDKNPLHVDLQKYLRIRELIYDAQKFYVKDWYNFAIDPQIPMTGVELLHSPYPLVWLETRNPDDGIGRAMLIVEVSEKTKDQEGISWIYDTLRHQEGNESFGPWFELCADSFIIFPFFDVEEQLSTPLYWIPSSFFGYLPRDQAGALRIGVKYRFMHPNDPIAVLPARFTTMGWAGNEAKLKDEDYDEDRLSLLDAVMFCVNFLAASNCKNVSVDTVVSADSLRKINAKRKKRGRVPLFEYHSLRVNLKKRAHVARNEAHGTHASPRQHYRRGHIRILPSGNSTWVRPHLVGSPLDGHIEKEYVLL